MSRRFWPCHAPGHAATARSRMVSDGSGTSSASVTRWTTPEAVALRARPDRGVGREPVGVHDLRRARRIAAGAREEHPQRVRERRDRPDRRPRRPAAPALLERHRRRQPVDLVDVRHPGLLQQAPRVRRHGLEVPPLRLRVDRPERQRRLPRPRHPGEDDHRVARDVHVDVAQVVLARAADADAAVVGRGQRGTRFVSPRTRCRNALGATSRTPVARLRGAPTLATLRRRGLRAGADVHIGPRLRDRPPARAPDRARRPRHARPGRVPARPRRQHEARAAATRASPASASGHDVFIGAGSMVLAGGGDRRRRDRRGRRAS